MTVAYQKAAVEIESAGLPTGLPAGLYFRALFDAPVLSVRDVLSGVLALKEIPDSAATPIEDIEGLPVIGQLYSVWCVQQHRGEYPVHLPAHSDPGYFPDAGNHYHYDQRFLTDFQVQDILGIYFSQRPTSALMLSAASSYVSNSRFDVVRRNLPCIRQMPDFPEVWVFKNERMEENKILARMERDYADVKLKPDCQRCPHRGIPLTGMPADADGNVVCPGHGLRWNTRTGALAARLTGGGK